MAADYRSVQTGMWREDEWFQTLELDARLFWMYLFTNPSASVAGIYRLPLRTMAFESGISQERIEQLLDQFAKAHKAYYENGVVWVRKMRDYQLPGKVSPQLQAHIVKEIAKIPAGYLKSEYIKAYGYPSDTVSIPSLTETETETETQTETPPGSGNSGPLADVCDAYHRNIGLLTKIIADKLADDVVEYGAPWVLDAIAIAVTAEKRDLRYVEGVLKKWRQNGRTNGNGKSPPPQAGYAIRYTDAGAFLPDGSKVE